MFDICCMSCYIFVLCSKGFNLGLETSQYHVCIERYDRLKCVDRARKPFLGSPENSQNFDKFFLAFDLTVFK